MNIEKKIKGVLCELSGLESVKNSFHLQEDIALDSLMMVTLLLEIEDVFNIQLEEVDMNPFELTTVQSVIDMVAKYVGGDKDE